MRVIAVLFFAMLAISCGKHDMAVFDDDGLAEVVFVNESRYSVSIHNTSFSGPVLVERLVPGGVESVTTYASNNYGVGSVFPIRYWYRMENSDTWIVGTDPDPEAQITRNIESGQRYVIYIPQPKNLVGADSYLKIKNNSTMSIEFNRLSVHFKQVNGEIPVPSGQTGIYALTDHSPSGIEYDSYYTVSQVGGNYYPMPNFIAITGYIYNFEFDGTQVIQKEVEKTL